MSSRARARTRWRPTRCRDCGTKEAPISTRALCTDCAIKRQTKSAVQQVEQSGPYYDAWRESMRRVANEL